MKRLLVAVLSALMLLVAARSGWAVPIPVGNFSFEVPDRGTTGTTWTNAITPWTGTSGNNNGNAFIEWSAATLHADAPQTFTGGAAPENDQYLGMALSYDVWYDVVTDPGLPANPATPATVVNSTPVTYQAASEYTLKVAVGNRSGQTNTANQSQYFLADTTTALYATGSVNASTLAAVGFFAEAPAITFNTTATPAAVGKTIRVLFRARGAGRSHYDNVRLFRTSPAVLTHGASPTINSFTATIPVIVTSNGDAANTSGVLYWGTTDGGTNAGAWANSVPLGSALATGATLNAALSGLTPGVTYYYRAKGTNFAGDGWAASTGSFVPPVPSVATIQNDAATLVATHSAQLNGQVLQTGGDNPVITTYWGTTDGGTVAGNWQFSAVLGAKGIGTFSNTPTNLLHSTTYFYRSSATNASGTVWAPATLSFTTDVVTTPSVAIAPAIGVTGNTALLNGKVVSLGNEAPTITFFWGATDGATNPANWASSATLPAAQSGAFGWLAANLSPNTSYFWTVRATNSGGTSWAATSEALTTNVKTPVVINEVNYDPEDHTKRLEFVELWNPSTTPVDVSGWSITGPADFIIPASTTIAANGYLVIAENPTQLNTAYTVTALGPWTGVLGNASGHVVLRNALGTQIDDVDYKQGFPWPTRAAGGGSSMELINPALENDVGGSWRSSVPVSPSLLPLPTPGRKNSTYADVAPPSISQVGHAAVSVTPQGTDVMSGQDVKITAHVEDRNGVGSVVLQYQIVDPGTYIPLNLVNASGVQSANPAYQTGWVSVPMADDGTGGDAIALDGLYTATLPGSLSVHRRLIRYRFVVTDVLGTAVQAPYSDDEQPNFAYFIYNGAPGWSGAFRPAAYAGFAATAVQNFSASLINSLEPWHLIAADGDVINCQYNSSYNDKLFNGTLVYNGQVYDHINFKIRGIGSTYNTGKNKWALKFNRARDFQAIDNWGQPFKETWNSVSLDANADPWASVHRGAAGIEEATSYRAFELAGLPSLRTTYVHFRVIRRAVESNAAGSLVTESLGTNIDGQYSNDLFGLYMALEPTEGNLLDERKLPDGNIYSIEGNNGDQKHQSTTQPVGTDWTTFRTNLAAAGQTEAWYRANMDLNALYTFMGVSRLVGNVDVRPGDNYRYYHRSTDDRWVIMPYDLDMMFIAAHHWGGTMDSIVVAGAPNSVMAMMRWPAIAQEYRNRCRELLGLMASDATTAGGQIGQLLDEYAQMVNPTGVALTWADLDANMWNLHPRTSGNGGNTGQNNSRGNFFRATFLDGTRGGLGGTVQTATWIRNIPDPDNDNFGDHEGFVQWFTNYATNTYPSGAAPWTRKATSSGPNAGGSGADSSVDRQKGYGYKYLEWESLYGGYFNANVNPAAGVAIGDLDAAGAVLYPNKPTIGYSGTAGYPTNGVKLHSSDFADPQGAGTVAAVQWRVAEISAPGIPLYDPTKPRIYEVEELWRSAELPASTAAIADVAVPTLALRAGHTYRARVRHKDTSGRWSFWSEPLQFVAGTPDVTALAEALVVSEVNYNPGAASPAESLAGYGNDDFEFVEIKNISSQTVDLTDVRFTKGLDFDFPAGMTLAPGAFKLVVRNPAAFQMRYGHALDGIIAGSYPNDILTNGGEEIKLSYGTGTPLRDFVYDDVAPWPTAADGAGPTLTLIAPMANPDHALATSWKASALSGGSPGADETVDYAAWAGQFNGVNDPNGDTDNDGIVNRLEFAFGGSPVGVTTLIGGNGTLPEGSLLTNPAGAPAGTYLGITFTRPGWITGVTYSVEVSTELVTWTGGCVLVSSTPNADGTVTEVWRSPTSIDPTQRHFIRGRAQ